jgi:DmsE family decaheme c-type cytochrome
MNMFNTRMTPKAACSAFFFFLVALGMVVFSSHSYAVPPGMELIFKGGPKPVIFSGKIHADAGLKCMDCHASLFKMKAVEPGITFMDHMAGKKYCYACHNGTKAFAPKGNCSKCHGNESPTPGAKQIIVKPAEAPAPAAAAESKTGAPEAAAPPPAQKEEEKLPVTLEEKEARLQELAKSQRQGVETCIGCHDQNFEPPIFPIFKTKHGVAADPRTPFANDQCEACHGPGGVHVGAQKKRGGTIIAFGKNAWTPVPAQNAKCLACHENHQRIEWKGSTHEFNGLACASCHRIHVAKDPVLDRQTQAQVCFTCHRSKQAKFFEMSHHPVREGDIACSDCHNVHGEDGTGLMVKALTREKCTSCHAEKRGPFLWEHEPVAEDCTICHDPHGSNQPALLKKRVPQLCQQCHDPEGHPSVQYDGVALSGGSIFLQAKGCLNCHSAIHGSNDPSGSTLLR